MLLRTNCTLKVLDIGWNDIKDAGMTEIAEGLKNNKSLTTLNVSRRLLSGKGCEVIYKTLMRSYSYIIWLSPSAHH